MLDVLLYDRSIGVIVCEPGTGVLSFVLHDSYLDEPAHPVLGQQFEERRHHRVFRQAAHPGRLPSFFANLLPEGALQSMIAAQTPDGSDAGTLAFVGEDLPGLDERFVEFGQFVFAIERYDRTPDGSRIHQEDFAQVRGIPPDLKYGGASYEGLARFVGDQCGRDDLLEFIHRTVFMLLSGNTDAHLKNWSLVYPDKRSARLAPAYDFVFVRNYPGLDRRLALPLAKEREREPERIGWEHFQRVERFLRDHGLDEPIVKAAREFAALALQCWRDHRGDVEPEFRRRLDAYHDALPIVTQD